MKDRVYLNKKFGFVFQVAINWAGGWHHAKRNEAAGFCYLNDIVLGLHRLLRLTEADDNEAMGTDRKRLVMYLDLDLHHDDGVEEAFVHSPRLLTFSVHHASPGFFPGSGSETSSFTGAGHGHFSAFNLPLGNLPHGLSIIACSS